MVDHGLLKLGKVKLQIKGAYLCNSVQFSSVQLLGRVQLFGTPWTVAHQASLSTTNSRNLLKLMSIESEMPTSHLILCQNAGIYAAVTTLMAESEEEIQNLLVRRVKKLV